MTSSPSATATARRKLVEHHKTWSVKRVHRPPSEGDIQRARRHCFRSTTAMSTEETHSAPSLFHDRLKRQRDPLRRLLDCIRADLFAAPGSNVGPIHPD